MQTMKSLEQIFRFRQHTVRTVRIDGEPWFAAADVCGVLGLDASTSVTGRRSKGYADGLDADEKGTALFGTLGGRQEMLIVSEPGLYSLIMRSHKRRRKAFSVGSRMKSFRRCASREAINCRRRVRPASGSGFPGAICCSWRWRRKTNASSCAARWPICCPRPIFSTGWRMCAWPRL